jgi:hypothetical protein
MRYLQGWIWRDFSRSFRVTLLLQERVSLILALRRLYARLMTPYVGVMIIYTTLATCTDGRNEWKVQLQLHHYQTLFTTSGSSYLTTV